MPRFKTGGVNMKAISENEFTSLSQRNSNAKADKQKIVDYLLQLKKQHKTLIAIVNLHDDLHINRIHYNQFMQLRRDDVLQSAKIQIAKLKATNEQDPHYIYSLAIKF